MKRIGGIFDGIAEWNNLSLAVWKAARGKSQRTDVRAFRRDMDERIDAIRGRILSGEGPVGEFNEFKIWDPKPRLISAPCFEDRVMHHAVMNRCEPVFERFQIFHSYACRPGKGQFRAIAEACRQARRHAWYLKLDVRKFFDSVPRGRLLGLLERRFSEERLLELFASIVDTWNPSQDRGLPIGTLMSQHFANFFLGHLDHYVKQELRVRGYVRYMDDFVLWGNCRSTLNNVHQQVELFCEKTLQLELKPAQLNATSRGMDYLGYRVFPGRAGLARASRVRFQKMLKEYRNAFIRGELNETELQERQQCLVAWTERATCQEYRRRVLLKLDERP